MIKIDLSTEEKINDFFSKESKVRVSELSKIIVSEEDGLKAYRVEAGGAVSLQNGIPVVDPEVLIQKEAETPVKEEEEPAVAATPEVEEPEEVVVEAESTEEEPKE